MSSDEFEREDPRPDLWLLAESGDDVALGCESALPFLTARGEWPHLDEAHPWTALPPV